MTVQIRYHKDELQKITTGQLITSDVDVYDIDNQTGFNVKHVDYAPGDGRKYLLGHIEDDGMCRLDYPEHNLDSMKQLHRFGINYTRTAVK